MSDSKQGCKTAQSDAQVIDLRIRKSRRTFLPQVNQAINWAPIVEILEKYYPKGKADTGRKAYSALLLFKMSLLQTWYGLSDYAVEEQVNDSLSFNHFCELTLHDHVPDHSVLSRFRTTLSEAKVWDKLLKAINTQFEAKGILLKEGAIVDASLTQTDRKPKGKKTHQLREDKQPPLVVQQQPGVDSEGAWVKKGDKLSYGYKRHYAAESASGLVLAVETTAANVHESKHLVSCVSKAQLPASSYVYADKGYCSQANETALRDLGLCSGIQKKATRSRALSEQDRLWNKVIGRVRYKIERVFGSIKSWFGGLRARYVGRIRVHGQHVLEAIGYNLYRMPRLIAG